MLIVVLVGLSTLMLVLLIVLLARGRGGEAGDPRVEAMVAALQRVGEQLTRVDARTETLERHVRESFETMRREQAELAQASRTELAASVAELRGSMQQSLEASAQRLTRFTAETNEQQTALREALNRKLAELMESNVALQERLRGSMEERLTKLNADNSAKLEEMRVTVDEKLHATLQTRLTESFGQVTTHLGEVQKGLGEMKDLATGVGDLKKVLSNVKARGVMGEFLLGQQLEQMFSPEQYIKNARIKAGSQEAVEYALKFPNGEDGYVLLAIDSKFPKEDWERLEAAYESGSAEEIAAAGKSFERAIKAEGKTICDKYIDPPTTLPHAIMFLPTESLYAEVVRRPGLQSAVQQECHVTIAGPATFMAILTSFQMGFHTLAIQKKGDEVWRVLSATKHEFGKFEKLMDRVEGNVTTMQNTLKEIGTRTRVINKTLKNVSSLEAGTPVENLLQFDEIAGVAPRLAAGEDEEE